MKVIENVKEINQNIEVACQKVNRHAKEITLIAVTKYVSIERAQEAVEAGILHLGENRDEGLTEKSHVVDGNVSWHFIGSLQTRKVKNIIDKVTYIHSLDRLSLAKEINKRANRVIKCFVQVNVSGEASKHGLATNEVIPFIKELAICDKIEVVGLMTMAPHTDDQGIIRTTFKNLKALQQEISKLNLDYAPCKELSMGMSNDYTIAIEEGATFIRIGTSLVGE